jgi:biopolymer transport protein ExbD
MKYRILMALLAIGLCSDGLAQANGEFPRIGLVGAGAGKTPVSRDQFIILVVEGPYLSYEKNQIPDGGVVEYVNTLLKTKDVSYIGVYTREGVKYGDVVRAVDVLRKTNAKNIGISMTELPAGRNP